jgi:phosphate:Na+ symporter
MNSSLHHEIMYLFGGLALFMYGMTLASDYLQRLAANKVRKLFTSLSDKNWLAIFVGVFLTVLMQSSGAVTSMLVGLGSAEVIALRQVMGVIVGTAIGSTITVQIISFNITQYGLPIFVLAFVFFFGSKKTVTKNLSGVLMGFGLIFWGLEMMSFGAQVVKTSPTLLQFLQHMSENPLVAILVTGLFTAFVHSSAVTIGLAMSLASSGLLSLHDCMFWIFGANIGTTSTALMAAAGGNYIGKQVAWAHFLFKLGGVTMFYFVTQPFVDLVVAISSASSSGSDMSRAIANANTLLNVITAIVFYPLINRGANLVQKIFPKTATDQEFGPKYINQANYNNSTLAIEKARREVLRMGDIVLSMVRDSIELFKGEDADLIETIHKRDNYVDLLHREIKMYLVRFTDNSGHLGKPIFNLISFVGDLESVADVVDKGLMDLARKKQALKLEFSEQGWEELNLFHCEVLELVSMGLSCFHLQDTDLAQKVVDKKRTLRDLEKKLQESHYDRLNKGFQETINTSSIHLEVLSDYRRIIGLATKSSYNFLRHPSE